MDLLAAIENADHTQASLARELGITAQAVNQWVEKGSVPPNRAARVAKLLGVSKRDLCPEFEWQ